MTQLQLSDVRVGKPQVQTKWDYKTEKYIDLDLKQELIKHLSDRDLKYVDTNLPDVEVYHKNYIGYLEKCWAEHLGIVITPDIIWYTLLCEIASLVKSNPEQYRHLFSNSSEKQDIVVDSGDMINMPLSTLVDMLKLYVPTDSDKFFQDFTTSSQRSRHAMRSAFCDMCSPYYNYMMLLCGFPAIDIRGTEEDYYIMSTKFKVLSLLFEHPWFGKVQDILDKCFTFRNDPDWWNTIFSLEECGSGSQVIVNGWFSQLFIEEPKIKYPENYPSGISIVDYKQLNTGKEYRMQDGLLFSKMDGDFLVPDFGFVIHERLV